MGLLQGTVSGIAGTLVCPDHGARQHCDVGVRADPAIPVEAERTGIRRDYPARMKQSFFYRKVILPIIDLMRQGITPEKIALSLAFGIGLGVFPVLGSTTILCALAAIVFRLNLPSIQLVNYFVYPLQLGLLIPFLRFGEILFRSPHVSLSLTII